MSGDDGTVALLLGALASVAVYALGEAVGFGWTGRAVSLGCALVLAGATWLGDRREEREDRDRRGVTYAGFGDLPEADPDEVFDPWLDVPTVRRRLTPEYHPASRLPDLPPYLPVEAAARTATDLLVQTRPADEVNEVLARWDVELEEFRQRWDLTTEEMSVTC